MREVEVAALGCDFAVIERLDVHAVIDSYRRLYAQGWHGEPPAPVMYQRFFDRGPDWVRAVIPLDRLNFQTEEESGAERVRRARQYAARGTPFPPGTASYGGRARQRRTGKAYVQDGNHRVLAAHFRGDCAIEMFMPEDEFYAVVEDARWRDDGAGEMRETVAREPQCGSIYYHATPAKNLARIRREGLIPGSGTTFDTGKWSEGKVFLARGRHAADQWREAVYEMLFEPIALVEVRVPRGMRVHIDAVAASEGDACVYYVEGRIPPENVSIVDPGTALHDHRLREAAPISSIWYHLTDRAKFKLDPKFAPADNAIAIVDRSGRPGIYLGQSVEAWVNGFGYWRPFVVEFEVDPSVVNDPGVHGRYGGEMFVPSTSFDKLTIRRVIPIDAHAREEFGMPGWIELELGTAFDTGEPFPGRYPYIGLYRGYRYPGPDVRAMPAADANRLKRQLRQVKR